MGEPFPASEWWVPEKEASSAIVPARGSRGRPAAARTLYRATHHHHTRLFAVCQPTLNPNITTMSDVKVFTLEDLQAHKSREDLYLLISGKVYDATQFLDEVGTHTLSLPPSLDDITRRTSLPAFFFGSDAGGRPSALRAQRWLGSSGMAALREGHCCVAPRHPSRPAHDSCAEVVCSTPRGTSLFPPGPRLWPGAEHAKSPVLPPPPSTPPISPWTPTDMHHSTPVATRSFSRRLVSTSD